MVHRFLDFAGRQHLDPRCTMALIDVPGRQVVPVRPAAGALCRVRRHGAPVTREYQPLQQGGALLPYLTLLRAVRLRCQCGLHHLPLSSGDDGLVLARKTRALVAHLVLRIEGLSLVHGSISQSLASTFLDRMQSVAQDFAQQHLADQKLPKKDLLGYTLLLAMRRSEFEAFAAFRR